jgi:DNA-binding MarR family transcriptional regulator
VATVNDLVEAGLALREPDPEDRRRNIVTITRRGGRVLERLDGVLDEIQEAVLEPLTPSERKTLARLLKKLT